MTSKLYPYTIKDTNRTIHIRKVPPTLAREAMRSVKEPEPPVNEVEYPDGRKVLEPNSSDPVYLRQLEESKRKRNEAINRLLIERGVFIELTDEDRKEVEELRQYWIDAYKTELEGSDQFLFVNYICIGTAEDLEELIQEITRRSHATPEAVASASRSF